MVQPSPRSSTCDVLRGVNPTFPLGFGGANREPMLKAGKRLAEQQWFVSKLFEPPLIGESRVLQPEVEKRLGVPVDQRIHAKLLRKPLQLPQRRRSLHQIDEVHLDSALRKKPERFPCL